MKIALLIDAAYLDEVARNLAVHFQPDAAPTADLCRWLDCIALDAGIKPGENQVQAVFIHSQEQERLIHFQPTCFAEELDGKAFHDNIAEFTLQSIAVEPIVSLQQMLADCAEVMATQQFDKTIIVADSPSLTEQPHLSCSMQPTADIILGYSVMAALGIQP